MMCDTDDDESRVFLTRNNNLDVRRLSCFFRALIRVFSQLYRLCVLFLNVLVVTTISLYQLIIQKRIRVTGI
jgi:hypothetical protein